MAVFYKCQTSNFLTILAAPPPLNRVISISIGNEPIEPNRFYRLATSGYIADGGDGYSSLKEGKTLKVELDQDILWRIVANRIQQEQDVAFLNEGRILAVKGAKQSINTALGMGLTIEETSWLEKKGTIRVANETDWPPFDYVKEKNIWFFH